MFRTLTLNHPSLQNKTTDVVVRARENFGLCGIEIQFLWLLAYYAWPGTSSVHKVFF